MQTMMFRFYFIFALNLITIHLFADVSLKPGNRKHEIDSLLNRATIELSIDPDNTIRAVRLALKLIYKIEDSLLEAYALDLLGNAYQKKGNIELGFETLYDAYHKCGDTSSLTLHKVCLSIADVYRTVNDEEKALQFNMKAMNCAHELQDSSLMALCYNMFGLIYEGSRKFQQAEEFFSKSLALNRQLGDWRNVAINLSNLCIYENDRPLEKIELLKEAIRINESFGMDWSLAENYNNMGLQYYYAGQYQQAEQCLEEAMSRAESLHAKVLICDNLRYSALLNAALGNYKKAYQNQLDKEELSNSIVSDRIVRRVETDFADKLLANKQTEIQLKQWELNVASLKNQLLGCGIGLAIIFALFVFIGLRLKSKKRLQLLEARRLLAEQEKQLVSLQLTQVDYERLKTEAELAYSRGELTNFACFIRSRSELLDGIKGLVREGYSLPAEQLKNHLKKISLYIAAYQHKNNELKDLVENVNLVNSDFVDRLTAKHPDLSKNEKHLASLLRIDLSAKEIASLINSTAKTVSMAIYRLRKKLDIDTDEKLSDYMKKM